MTLTEDADTMHLDDEHTQNRAINDLDEELKGLDDSLKSAWMEAQQQCPHLVGSRHKMMFLRSERFHSQLAALRLVRYWSKRVELFGREAAFLSLTTLEEGRSALRVRAVDMEALQFGNIQWTRQHDDEGRGIVWVHWTKIPPGYSRGKRNRLVNLPALCRALWFIVHAALDESDDAQRNGLVFLSEDKGWGLRHVDVNQSVQLLRSGLGSLPFRVIAIHAVHSPILFKWIIFPCFVRPILKNILIDAPTVFHYGSKQQLLEQLKEYHIPQSIVPTQLGGQLILRHNEWLEQKKTGTTDPNARANDEYSKKKTGTTDPNARANDDYSKS